MGLNRWGGAHLSYVKYFFPQPMVGFCFNFINAFILTMCMRPDVCNFAKGLPFIVLCFLGTLHEISKHYSINSYAQLKKDLWIFSD